MKKTEQSKMNTDGGAEKKEQDEQSAERLNPNEKRERLHVNMDNLSVSRTTPEDLKEEPESEFPDAQLKESKLTKEDFEGLGPQDPGAKEDKKDERWPLDFEAREE